MLVSHTKKFIFIKTAKTAGTSVESYFEKYCFEPGTWELKHERNQQVNDFGMVGGRGLNSRFEVLHAHLSAAKIRLLLPKDQWENYFKFSVIRNPFDRLVSRFFFNMKRDSPDLLQVDDAAKTISDFRNFVTQRLYKIEDHLLIDEKLATDFLIRYESLESDIEIVCDKLDIEFNPECLPTFKSGIRDARYTIHDLYDDATRQFVELNYRSELEKFGYCYPVIECDSTSLLKRQ